MLLKSFWAYLLGCLVVAVSGPNPERFINLAVSRGVPLWDLVRVSDQMLLVMVYAGSFRSLRHIAKKSGCRLRIRSRRGLPFLWKRLRKRKMLVGGAVIFVFLVYLLCSIVWTVQVEGTRRVPASRIIKVAAAAGLRPGVIGWQVDGQMVAETLMRQVSGVAFAEVEVRPRARIRIIEKVIPKVESGCYNVVAGKDGLVERLLVLAGHPLVQEGDVVKKGDVVISGMIPGPVPAGEDQNKPVEQSPPRYVAAQGLVRARIWYRAYGEAPCSEVREVKTGRKTTIACIRMENKEIIIKGPAHIPYTLYQRRVRRWRLPGWRNINLPVEFVTIDLLEIKRETVHRSHREALELALRQARSGLAGMLPRGVSPERVRLRELEAGDPGYVRVVLTAETVEEIGVRRRCQPPPGASSGQIDTTDRG